MMLFPLWEECARCGHVGECESPFPPSGECPVPEIMRTGTEHPYVIQRRWNHQHLFRSVKTGKGPASSHPNTGAGLSSWYRVPEPGAIAPGMLAKSLAQGVQMRFGVPVTAWLPASTASVNRQCVTAVGSRGRLGYRA